MSLVTSRWDAAAAGTAILAALGLIGAATLDADPQQPRAASAPLSTVEQLPVTESLALGYDRDEFGSGWADADGDQCDTRAEVLMRDLTREAVRDNASGGCLVLYGTLRDPYTRERDVWEARDLDVDHIVSLADAWRTGAYAWTDAQREAFANDPANLTATDASVNRSKGDKGPDEWEPPAPAAECWYATTYVDVKATYGLAVTPQQRDALTDTLKECQ